MKPLVHVASPGVVVTVTLPLDGHDGIELTGMKIFQER